MMIDSNHLAAAVSAKPRLDRNLKLSPSSDHSKEHSIQQRHSKQEQLTYVDEHDFAAATNGQENRQELQRFPRAQSTADGGCFCTAASGVGECRSQQPLASRYAVVVMVSSS